MKWRVIYVTHVPNWKNTIVSLLLECRWCSWLHSLYKYCIKAAARDCSLFIFTPLCRELDKCGEWLSSVWKRAQSDLILRIRSFKKKDLCLSSAHLISHAFTNCYMCTVAAGQQQPAMIQSFKYLSDPYLSLQKIWKCAHSRLDILPYFGLC